VDRLVGTLHGYCGLDLVRNPDRSKSVALWHFADARSDAEPIYVKPDTTEHDMWGLALRVEVSNCTAGASVLDYSVADIEPYERCEPVPTNWDGKPRDFLPGRGPR
jgi:hypothetical protein